MKKINWKNVEEAKEFEKLPAGGYVCGITAVEDVPEKEYLRIEYDIAEGEFKNHWRDLYTNHGFWGGNFIKSYKEKAMPFFKGFLTAIENSNPGFSADYFDNDESELKRKLIGLVIGLEEYKANDGKIKTRTYVDSVRSVDSIKKGDFEVPELKKYLAEETKVNDSGFMPVESNDDLPF